MKRQKMGRPTTDPKPIKLTVRINEQSKKILDDYCAKTGKTMVEGVRDGINSLKDK